MLDELISALLQALIFSLVPVVWWLITARTKENFFVWIGLKKPVIKGSPWKLALTILAIAIGYILLMILIMTFLMKGVDTATSQFSGQGLGKLPEILIYSFIQTALSEEIFFRGFLAKRLIKKLGFALGNTLQALAFGLLHGIPFGLTTGNWAVFLLLVLLPGTIGWLQGWMNEKKSSGSILPSWITHSLMNLAASLAAAL